MSFLESLLLIGLGFALATLVGLFVGRVLWKVALRVGARRIQRQVPVTVTELQSDRDRMRAEYAMLSRKMQLAQDSLKMQLAERTAEVMQHRNRVELLNADLGRGATVSSSMDLELQRLRQRVAPLEAELASRTASYQQLRDEQRKKDETIASLTAELAKRNRQIEAFKSEGAKEAPVRSAQDRLSQRIEALTALSKQIADQRERFARDREVLVDLQKAFSATTAEKVEPEPKLEEIAVNGRELEENLRAAESETDALVREMHDLDAAVNLKVEEFEQVRNDAHPVQVPTQTEGAPQPRLRTLGNVVTLASRLRPAQKDASG
jgi:chromosome segregation ATPase